MRHKPFSNRRHQHVLSMTHLHISRHALANVVPFKTATHNETENHGRLAMSVAVHECESLLSGPKCCASYSLLGLGSGVTDDVLVDMLIDRKSTALQPFWKALPEC